MLAAYPAPKEPDIQVAFKVLLIFHFFKVSVFLMSNLPPLLTSKSFLIAAKLPETLHGAQPPLVADSTTAFYPLTLFSSRQTKRKETSSGGSSLETWHFTAWCSLSSAIRSWLLYWKIMKNSEIKTDTVCLLRLMVPVHYHREQ